MKHPPETAKLEAILRSSKLTAFGFMGDDVRPPAEIIESDAAELAKLNYTVYDIADRMREITVKARAGLGTSVRIGENLEATASATRGQVPCPWPHAGRFPKTVVTLRRTDGDRYIRWSELSIHLIEAHGFFEGKGAPFRLSPRELVGMLF
ncbi:hypothetical protein ACFLQU_01635 [Verrucomicrobiota bacterium]